MSSSFWEMGGYATFVWGSYGITALVLLWNLLAPGVQRRRLMRRLAEEAGAEFDDRFEKRSDD